MTRTSLSIPALLSSAPFAFQAGPVLAAEATGGSSTSLTWMLGALAAAGIGAVLWSMRAAGARRGLEIALNRSDEARLSSDEALNALLLDRADGAAIWSGTDLHMTAGNAKALDALDDPSDLDAVARALVGLESAPELERRLRALVGEGMAFEERFTGPDGRSRLVSGVTLGARALVTLIDAKGSSEHLPRLSDRLVAAEAMVETMEEGFANAPIYVWRRDGTGRLVWVNRRYVEGVEAPDAAAVIDGQIELLSAEEAAVTRALAQRARESGEKVTERHTGIMEGARRTLHLHETPCRGGTFGYAVDISAQASASEALVRQMRANEETLDRLHRGVAVFNADMRLGFANETMNEIWRLDPALLQTHPTLREVLGQLRDGNRIPHTRNFQAWRDEFVATCRDLRGTEERQWHLPDGTALNVILQPHPTGGTMVLFDDVTAHYAMRRDAATVSAVYRATFSRLSEGVVVFGLDGRCRLANAAFRELWELPADEDATAMHISEMGRRCAHLYPDRALWAKAIAHVSAAGEAREVWAETLERTDGSVVQMASAPLPDGATMFAFSDTTDSFHKERMLREQNEQLEENAALRGKFLASIHRASQDLKTPLNTIVGYSDLLGQEMGGRLNERQHEFVDYISQASNELRHMIIGITDLAMLESNFFEFRLESVDIRPTLASGIDFIERSAGDGAEIVIDCPDDIGTLPGDASRFREVIHNLVSALRNEVGPDETVEVGVRRRPDHVAIWIGCRDSVIPRSIRDIFGRLDVSAALPQLHRLELGITLVSQFVERQGGMIAIETGEGTTREAIVCHFLRDADAVRAAINNEREAVQARVAE